MPRDATRIPPWMRYLILPTFLSFLALSAAGALNLWAAQGPGCADSAATGDGNAGPLTVHCDKTCPPNTGVCSIWRTLITGGYQESCVCDPTPDGLDPDYSDQSGDETTQIEGVLCQFTYEYTFSPTGGHQHSMHCARVECAGDCQKILEIFAQPWEFHCDCP